MSAPPGSRGSRTSTRARGSARGGSRARGTRNGAGQQQSGRGPVSSTMQGNSSQPYLKPPGQQNSNRNKSRNDPTFKAAQLSSAILDHAGKISTSKNQPWRNAAEQDSGTYKQDMNEHYQKLKENRERERKKAIKDGFLADPDKPTSLANAITPVGTCQDMCPEFERVERIVQLMVDANEKIPYIPNPAMKVPGEELMVKRFRRSAAGYDEQLPSDIRPPAVLQRTLNHLFDSIIGGPEPLASTHKFVWDRTRGIRNDFSIQQVTKVEDLRIAIDCFERIARFHILCLHQLSNPNKDNGEFDHHQEREQLNNTLLSLMYYYDDSRHKLSSPNEAEFRAYCIIFEIQDQRPDLEDRAQNWPASILKDPRVKTALKLYAAAGNTSDEQGPLRPRTSFATAQANTRGFFELVQSNAVSYVMACVAEIYFNLVRSTALESIWKAYKGKRPGAAKVEDWLLEDLTYALGFDDDNQVRTFCEEHEFEVLEREDREEFLNLGSVSGSTLKDNNPRRKQLFSRYLVEHKRLGRSLPAVINGLSVSDSQAQGLVHDSDADDTSVANSESLFVNEDSDDDRKAPRSRPRSTSASSLLHATTGANDMAKLNGTTTPLDPTSTFGAPSSKPNPFQPKEPAQNQSMPVPLVGSGPFAPNQVPNPFAPQELPKFDFVPPSNEGKPVTTATSSPFGAIKAPKFDFLAKSNATRTGQPELETAKSAAGEQKPLSSGVFGTPSTTAAAHAFPQSESISSQKSQAPAASMLSDDTSTMSSQSIPKLEISKPPLPGPGESQNKSVFGMQVGAAEPAATKIPSFSFQTSPLFQSMAKAAHIESQSQSSEPEVPITPNVPPADISTPNPPQPSPFKSSNPPTTALSQPSSNTSNLFPKESSTSPPKAPIPAITPSFNFQAPTASPFPNQNQSKEPFQSTPALPTSPPMFSPFPPASTRPEAQHSGPAPTSTVSAPSVAFPGTARPAPDPVVLEAPPPDLRPAALDIVTDALMFDEGGLLQQYIEMSIVPIMQSAVAQVEDEESWKEAREHRVILLAKKYFRTWKKNAWNLGVIRRGRERRQSLARSMQSLARRTQQRQEERSNSSVLDIIGSGNRDEKGKEKGSYEPNPMPPPAVPTYKRSSLPSDFNAEMKGAVQTPKKSKRKLDETDLTSDHDIQQPRYTGHKRSNTIGSSMNGDAVMSAPPHRFSRFRPRSTIDVSKLGDGSLLSNTIMRQVRRMAPNTRADTTQTDYFRLKALGVDPDTPVVPLTKKRAATADEVNRATQVPAMGSISATTPTLKRPRPSPRHSDQVPTSKATKPSEDEEEEFFASIRAIRSTLADSTSWFQSERESIERSMTPSQASVSPPSGKKETAAERRLREIKARGHTPSRSEIRLRAMGDKALLPEGFWDGEGMGKSLIGGKQGKGKEKGKQLEQERQIEPSTRTAPINSGAFTNQDPRQTVVNGNGQRPQMGFAAFANQRPRTGMVNGFGQHPQQQQKGGATTDDVIELSD